MLKQLFRLGEDCDMYRKRQHSAHEKAGCRFEKYGFDPGCSVAKAFV